MTKSKSDEINSEHAIQPWLFAALCVFVSVVVALFVRVPYFFRNDFVINDGALFADMANAVLKNNYLLPEFVTYNSTEIPFAYPPLAFYLIAILTDITPYDIIQIERFMPLVLNVICVGLFAFFAAKVVRDRLTLLLVSVIFPAIPRSFEWLIMGGGVTRSLGFFLQWALPLR